MSIPKLFGVYAAQFPFLDTQETKIRPVIVIGKPQSQYKVLAVVPISSRSALEDIDCSLRHWSNEGLLKPSVARVHRLDYATSRSYCRAGRIDLEDKQNLQTALKQLLNL